MKRNFAEQPCVGTIIAETMLPEGINDQRPTIPMTINGDG
jgi:hypothetical protein